MKNKSLSTVVVSAVLFFYWQVGQSAGQLIWIGCGISKKAFITKIARVYSEKTGIEFRMVG